MLASGKGTRLYPISTKEKPKQFIPLLSEKTMLRETIDRIIPIFDSHSIFVNSTERYREFVEKETHNALYEPYGIGQTTSILYITLELLRMYGDCKVTIFPTDHYIEDIKRFQNTIQDSVNKSTGCLDIIGVNPEYPETDYGYIKNHNGKIKRFIQKPDEWTAKYCVDNGFLWNTGIISFRAKDMTQIFYKYMPCFYKKFSSAYLEGKLKRLYNEYELPEGNIEGDIVEKIEEVSITHGDFGWSDIGNIRRFRKAIKNAQLK